MMDSHDNRHGSSAGYNAGCRCAPCWAAKQRYDKRRRWELHQTGTYRKVPAIGAQRRIEALQRLGWSVPVLSKRLGVTSSAVYDLGRYDTIYRTTHDRIAAVYEELSGRLPDPQTPGERMSVSRARNHAIRCGYLSPLAWLNIDDPDERPDMNARDDEVDEVVVLRILAGDFTLTANRAERYEVVRRWTGADNELERRTRWNVARMRREMGVGHAA